MPSRLKDLVRARREKTGQSHQQALRHVRAQEERSSGEAGPADARVLRARSVADTAFSVAAVRAEERLRPPEERLFDDPYASAFAAGGAHVAESTQRFLDLPFFRDGVRLRTRYLDDAVREGLAAGLDQVVLLGAGFDARGLRMPEIAVRGASVYEVDTREQLRRKRRLLADARVRVPPHVAFASCDFDDPRLEEALDRALVTKGFRRGAGAVVVWEGVIGYVTADVIDRTLRFVADAGGSGTRLAFTFGEGTFDPETAAVRARRAGFHACVELGGDDLWRRYLAGEPHPQAFVMKVATATV